MRKEKMPLPELWFDLPIAVFDIETTGLDAATDQIIEVGIVYFQRGERGEIFNWLIDPECKIPEDAVRITGIQQSDVEGKPKFHEVAKDILKALHGRGLVAYNIPFDRLFLKTKFEALGHKWPDEQVWFDPLIFAQHIFPQKPNKLVDVAERFNVSLEGAHRACNDAEATGHVFYAFKDYLPPRLEDLIDVQNLWERQNHEARAWRSKKPNDIDKFFGQNKQGASGLGAAYIYGDEPDPLRAYYKTVPSS